MDGLASLQGKETQMDPNTPIISTRSNFIHRSFQMNVEIHSLKAFCNLPELSSYRGSFVFQAPKAL